MTTYFNRTTHDTIDAAERVHSCLLGMREDGVQPNQDEIRELADDACFVLMWVREVLTGIDECGALVPLDELRRALAIIDEQRDSIQERIRERIEEN